MRNILQWHSQIYIFLNDALSVGESYTSRVTLFRPHLVTSVCEDMRLFEHLRSVWKFSPRSEHSCQVDFAVSFRFKSAAHSLISK